MRKKAFTLVELLVVMAVLSLLMALLMPALAKARQQGRSMHCLSNLRQMVIAALLYTNGNDDYFPMATVTEINGSVYRTRCWDFTTVYDSQDRRVEPGLLWQGEMIEKIQQCPSFRGAANWAQDPYTGYNYNTSYIGGRAAVKDGRAIPQTVVMSSKVSEVIRPGECAIFGDGQWADAAGNRVFRVVAQGEVKELPIQWRYYLIASKSGRRLALSFTLEGPLAERLGDADRRLVAAVELLDTKPSVQDATPETASKPSPEKTKPKKQ